MENKVINLLGVDYTEEKIQVLIDYLNHMEREMGPLSRIDSLIAYMIKSQQVSDAYMAEQSEEDVKLLEHFATARETVGKNHPKLKLLINTITVLAYGSMSVAIPPIVNLGVCAILAKFVTNNIRNLSEENAYNKIERLIKKNLE